MDLALWKEIECSINLEELVPILIECGLLDIIDYENTSQYRSRLVSRIRSGGEEEFRIFSSCFKAKERYDHMGHAYIACLLNRKPFADEKTIVLSRQCKKVLNGKLSQVVKLLSVKYLLPHLLQAGLLTPDEAASLSEDKRPNSSALSLLQIMSTKGPTAHGILVECIRDEKQHSGHEELYELVTRDNPLPSPNPCTPAELSCDETLSCPEYHKRRHKFEQYYHSGHWRECEELAQECMDSTMIEIQVIGNLELALSYIFRLNEDKVLCHVSKAEDLTMKIENSNRSFLCGRCKYLLALLYHYLDKPTTARKYIMEAKAILFEVEIGEDKSFAMYCDAIISAKTLHDKSSQYEFNEVIKKFEISLSYSSRTYDMDILVIYSFLRLGRLYLGRTETRLTRCTNKERIQASKDCQQKLWSDYFSLMDDRCKGLYYQNDCDLHMNHGDSQLASESVQQAQYYAERSDCPIDIHAIKTRLTALNT